MRRRLGRAPALVFVLLTPFVKRDDFLERGANRTKVKVTTVSGGLLRLRSTK